MECIDAPRLQRSPRTCASRTVATTVMAAGGEIEGDSSDKPARVELSFFEKKGEHSGGGGFAVSA